MFSKKHNFIQTTASVVKHPTKGSEYWVVGRDSLYYSAISLAGVSTKDYKDFIEQSIEHLNPFDEYSSYTIVKNEFAMVWIWDKKKQQNLSESQERINTKVVPEAVMKPLMLDDGVYLVALYEGFESQYWMNGVLRLSRWWHEVPSELEWQRFCRAVSIVPVSLAQPIVQKLKYKPWDKNFISNDNVLFKKILSRLWLGFAIIGLIILSKFITAYVIQYDLSTKLKHKMSQLELESASILEQKNKVIQSLDYLKRYSQIKVEYRQFDLMELIGSKFPKKDNIKVIHWFFDQDQLVIEIIGKKLDPSFYVSIYQKMPQFKSVFSEPGNKHGSLRLRFDLNMAVVN